MKLIKPPLESFVKESDSQLCICLNPALQKILFFPDFRIERVNRAVRKIEWIGGKGVNVAYVLNQLGFKSILLCLLGGKNGDLLRERLRGKKINTVYEKTAGETRECTTVLTPRGSATEIVEEGRPVNNKTITHFFYLYQNLLSRCRGLIISGSLPQGFPANYYQRLIAEANRFKKRVIIDSSGPPLWKALAKKPFLVRSNFEELEKTVGHKLFSLTQLKKAIITLIRKGALQVVISQGALGIIACLEKRFYRLIAPRIHPKNPIGSGDALTAGIMAGLIQKKSLLEACRFGAACGTSNATTLLSGVLNLDKISSLVRQIKIVRI